VESVTPRPGATPYSRWGNTPALLLAAALAILGMRRRRL
jgi:apolipoprotein N-acyltransferase